ncbi:MAG TPA: metallophosphoesterase [Thermoanaerobaculia bacterium]|nr:metallophosphoesterase [Thermoanaerobaculia bacterium]
MNFLLAITLAATIKSINAPVVSPGTTGDFVFVAGGDNRPTAHGAPWPRVLPTIFSEIRLIQPDFVIWSGDTIYGYGDSAAELPVEYAEFKAKAKRAAVPLINAPGNHEVHDIQGQLPCADLETEFKKHWGDLYGSFDYRGAHFIALDTEQCGHIGEIAGAQLDWLKQDLEANKSARAIFLFFHTEITLAPNDEDGKNHPPLTNKDELQALFEKYPVKAVFQGHEHLFYQTTMNGIQYFVAGGAGAPFYAPPEKGGFSHYLVVEIKGDQLTYKIVEPGHLYAEEGKAAKASEHLVWLINSSDLLLPARRIETTVPASLGKCADLVAESRLVKYDGTAIPVPVAIESCKASGKKNELTISATAGAPRRSSVPIYVHKK